MITAYDSPTARIADKAGADIILVGDSLANVVLGHALGVHAELLGAAAHFHARAFQLKVGINPHRYARARTAERGNALHFAFRFKVDGNARGHRLRKLRIGLAGPRKADRLRIRARRQCNL